MSSPAKSDIQQGEAVEYTAPDAEATVNDDAGNTTGEAEHGSGEEAAVEGATCPNFITCTVNSMFCGCFGLGVGTMVIMGLDFVAFILLIVSGALLLERGGTLALANGVFFLVAAMLLAVAVFIKERDWSNVFVWSSLFFHGLLVILCFAGWIWQVVNLADCDSNYCTPRAANGDRFCIDGHGDCIASNTIGFLTQLVYFVLLFHFLQVINSWRVRNMGGRPLNKIFNTNDMASAADAPKQ